MSMKRGLAGLLVSASVHVGLLLLVVYGVAAKPTPPKIEKALPLHLAMFQEAESIAVPEPKQEKKAEPTPVKKIETKKEVKKITPKKRIQKAKKKPIQKKTRKKKAKASPHIKPSLPIVKAAIKKSMPVRKATPVKKSAPPKPAQRNNKKAEQQYKSRLHHLIAKQKKYPARAKRRHEEGTVTISFVIYADGSINNLKVVQSSGSQILDQAALRAIKKISNRLPFPTEINRKQWQFTLPLVYHLR